MPEEPRTAVALAIEDDARRARAIAACSGAGIPVVAAETSVETCVERCADLPSVVVVSDADAGELPDAAVVLIAPSSDGNRARKALSRGVDGFVLEDSVETALAPTVRAVAAGQVCLPRQGRQQIGGKPLSYRERQVLGMVVMGNTNGEIARRLYLAESTVKSHLSSAFRKLGVRSRAEAAALVLDPAAGVGAGILTMPQVEGVASNGHEARPALTG
ncbi:MAG: helix-turn-helix transcriptional regulator [Thermoleophilaceae bacterium]